ncbi:hypothetical protein B484DRAFT_102602 [Ochromonadaceae sp. CCMP2298]|nr:hypothetical protein B484DRAFT_102602 [Ochromonadaceae sp. CCMP2298]
MHRLLPQVRLTALRRITSAMKLPGKATTPQRYSVIALASLLLLESAHVSELLTYCGLEILTTAPIEGTVGVGTVGTGAAGVVEAVSLGEGVEGTGTAGTAESAGTAGSAEIVGASAIKTHIPQLKMCEKSILLVGQKIDAHFPTDKNGPLPPPNRRLLLIDRKSTACVGSSGADTGTGTGTGTNTAVISNGSNSSRDSGRDIGSSTYYSTADICRGATSV